MTRKRRILIPSAIILGVLLFLVAVHRIFELRFATGDVFPPGSSRRADPLGTRAFLEALAELPGRRVSRNLEAVRRLEHPGETTLFLWGVFPMDLSSGSGVTDWQEVARFAAAGGRVVVGLSTGDIDRVPGPGGGLGTNGVPRFEPQQAWQFAFRPAVEGARVVHRQEPLPGLPESLTWPAGPSFVAPPPTWTTIYGTTNGAVLVRRAIGPGELILLSGDYLVRNEALRSDRQPALLAWLAGDRPRVVFDETHLGLSLEPGLASLVRRYRMAGGLAGLVLLAVLYVWRSSMPFHLLPAVPGSRANVVRGRPTEEGMLQLLHRSLPASDLPGVCLRTWQEDPGLARRVPSEALDAMQDLINRQDALRPRDRDPMGTYRELCRLLHPPRTPWKPN